MQTGAVFRTISWVSLASSALPSSRHWIRKLRSKMEMRKYHWCKETHLLPTTEKAQSIPLRSFSCVKPWFHSSFSSLFLPTSSQEQCNVISVHITLSWKSTLRYALERRRHSLDHVFKYRHHIHCSKENGGSWIIYSEDFSWIFCCCCFSFPPLVKEHKTKCAYKQVNGMKHLLSVQGVLNELSSAS